jgi:GntR family transcriptional regulator
MLISVNQADPRPIYQQIVAQVKGQVSTGVLLPGDELPGVRELAGGLGVNLHTVHHAYRELREAGIIYLRLGRRATVAPLRRTPASRKDVETALVGQLNDLITEAFHLRLSPDEFRRLVDRLLKARQKGVPS